MASIVTILMILTFSHNSHHSFFVKVAFRQWLTRMTIVIIDQTLKLTETLSWMDYDLLWFEIEMNLPKKKQTANHMYRSVCNYRMAYIRTHNRYPCTSIENGMKFRTYKFFWKRMAEDKYLYSWLFLENLAVTHKALPHPMGLQPLSGKYLKG